VVFLAAAISAVTVYGLAVAAAFFAAHRFFNAATIAALPDLLSFRFGFDVSVAAGAGVSDSPRILAQRRCWASFIRRRAAAENFFRFLVGASGVAPGAPWPLFKRLRSSAIWASMRTFCASYPSMAAEIISGVSRGVDIFVFVIIYVNAF
jgi:hypothetical protein